jgi:hypothetical protein
MEVRIIYGDKATWQAGTITLLIEQAVILCAVRIRLSHLTHCWQCAAHIPLIIANDY